MVMGVTMMMVSLVVLSILLPLTSSFSTTTNKVSSIGEAIQRSSNPDELLDVASQLWLPTDPDLPSHLRSQLVHHEKRQRWSAQLLDKLSSSITTTTTVDDRLQRAILGASIPFTDQPDRPTKEGRYVRQALVGLHALVGKLERDIQSMEGVKQLIERANAMATDLPLAHVVEMRFAARGLLARVGGDSYNDNELLHDMDERVSHLPFDILPRGVDWDQVLEDDNSSAAATLHDAIPFKFDTITTRTGAVVVERRSTAWLAEPGIGALAYSGKLMAPQEVPPVVKKVMRATESALGDDCPDGYFDCALCNHYPNAEAACKFHTDPEHGIFWERLTCVVAAGDARRFAFRPIPGESQWSAWDTINDDMPQEETAAAAIHLFPGDVVQMWGDCNDLFHHAVYTASGDAVVDAQSDGRVSLVLKRAMDRGGKRGHGLQGTGRRRSRNASQQPPPSGSSTRRRRRRRGS